MENKDLGYISNADFFLKDIGYITPYHLNVYMITALSICKEAIPEDTEINIDQNNHTIEINFSMGWFKKKITPKKKRVKQLTNYFNSCLSEYKLTVNF